jgi:hypothetical protein
VFTILGTRHCKRCKNIWHDGRKNPGNGELSCRELPASIPQAIARQRSEPLRARLEKELEDCLQRYGGRFSPERMTRSSSAIPGELLRRYIRICVKNRTLEGKKDRDGTTWYRRPG